MGVLGEIGFDINKASNYSIEPNADVHELMLNSDAFCALQSSTVIESAISGKRVILPAFENYRSTENYLNMSS
jgi:spore coat polysaccharide biosynthesis predicted glycosyltransferase SpsG